MRARSCLSALAAGSAALLTACTPRSTARVDEPTWVPAPAPADTLTTCADVHGARACWALESKIAVARVDRPVPNTFDAWRCAGQGSARVCRRREGAGAFVCPEDGGRCVQDHLRMPDDGEWECFARAGTVICRGGEPAAGVVAGRRDPAWICGERRDAGAPTSSEASNAPVLPPRTPTRVCIDLAPDRPKDASFSTCSFQQAPGGGRQVCERRAEPALGAACDADGACPKGAICEHSVCLPARAPRGECWLDTDCGAGATCVFTTCEKGS